MTGLSPETLTTCKKNHVLAEIDFSYQMLDLFSIGRSEDQKERYTSVQIALNEARSLDMEQPKAKRILLEFMRPVHVEAGKYRRKLGSFFFFFCSVSRSTLYV